MDAYLLIASEREDDHEFCRKVSDRAGIDFVAAGAGGDIESFLRTEKRCLFFWDIDSPNVSDPRHPFSIARLLPTLIRNVTPNRLFALASRSVFELPSDGRLAAVNHFCVRHYTDFAVDWIARLLSPVFSPEPFGLDYYAEPGSVIEAIELRNSTEKAATLETLALKLRKKRVDPRASHMILGAVDELIMNAMFDAPVDARGARYRREFLPEAAFAFDERERVTVRFCLNTKAMVIGVHDSFGSLVTGQASDSVFRDYSQVGRRYIADGNTKRAGLGLRGIAASGLATVISSRAGSATEAVVSFPYYRTYRECRTGFRSFSFNIRD